MTPAKEILPVSGDMPKSITTTVNGNTEGQVNGATAGSQDSKEKANPNRILRYAEVYVLYILGERSITCS